MLINNPINNITRIIDVIFSVIILPLSNTNNIDTNIIR